MKVSMGPYINRWTTSSFEHWWLEFNHGKHYWEVINEGEEDALDEFVERWCDRWQVVLNHTVNLYFDNKERKIDVHIDGYDVWGMDYTLSLIILPMLEKLKANKHGAPFVDDKDVPKALRSTSAPPVEDYETDGNHFERWEYVMDAMIWSFEQLVDEDNDDQFHTGNIDFVHTPVDKDLNEVPKDKAKLFRMDRGPADTHVYDRKGHEKHNKRIQKGLMLFGKYYRGLWD